MSYAQDIIGERPVPLRDLTSTINDKRALYTIDWNNTSKIAMISIAPTRASESILGANAFSNLLSKDARQDAIWIYLTKVLGIAPLQAAAIMGNISVETGNFASTTVENNLTNYNYAIRDGVGYGLLQWTYPSRKEGLLNFANETGGSVGDYDVQLNYMVYVRYASCGLIKGLFEISWYD